MTRLHPLSANSTWRTLINDIIENGTDASPRGLPTTELLAHQTFVDMTMPLLTVHRRRLSVDFAIAEFLWIMSGDNRVAPLLPYAPSYARYSDDGITLHGAYGPRVMSQIGGVTKRLQDDPTTRQAVIDIWRINPPSSKDIPCTLSVQWMIRNDMLYCIDTMRSSDAWLGWPYDVFTFSMISTIILLSLRRDMPSLKLGSLILNAGSQHLYDSNNQRAQNCDMAWEEYRPLNPDEFGGPGDFMTHMRSLLHRQALPGKFLTDLAWYNTIEVLTA